MSRFVFFKGSHLAELTHLCLLLFQLLLQAEKHLEELLVVCRGSGMTVSTLCDEVEEDCGSSTLVMWTSDRLG